MSITRRGETYRVQVYLPGGRRVSRTAYSEHEAGVLEARLRLEAHDGLIAEPERVSVTSWLARYLEAMRPTWAESTYRRRESDVRLHLSPFLGAVPLVRLAPAHVQEYRTKRLRDGAAPGTVRHELVVLRGALGNAVELRLLRVNAASPVKLPTADQGRGVAMSRDQFAALLAATEGHRARLIVRLAAATGMRRGELSELRWSDIDLDAGELHVRRAKTKAGVREIPVGPLLVEELRREWSRQREQRLALGGRWAGGGYVLVSDGGRRISYSTIGKWWAGLRDELGLSGLRLHDLRHTVCSLLMARTQNAEAVASLVGHATAAYTLSGYVHPDLAEKRNLIAALDALSTPNRHQLTTLRRRPATEKSCN